MTGKKRTVRTGIRKPRWLSPEAKKVWDDLAPKLVEREMLTELDVHMFAFLCHASAQAVSLAKTIEQEGFYYEAGGKLRIRPEVKMAKDQFADLKRIAWHFGISV